MTTQPISIASRHLRDALVASATAGFVFPVLSLLALHRLPFDGTLKDIVAPAILGATVFALIAVLKIRGSIGLWLGLGYLWVVLAYDILRWYPPFSVTDAASAGLAVAEPFQYWSSLAIPVFIATEFYRLRTFRLRPHPATLVLLGAWVVVVIANWRAAIPLHVDLERFGHLRGISLLVVFGLAPLAVTAERLWRNARPPA